MNLILLEPGEAAAAQAGSRLVWTADDPRAVHVRSVLRKGPGDGLLVGIPNGPRGTATLLPPQAGEPAGALAWHVALHAWQAADAVPPPLPITLLVGLPRPQTARKVLQEGTSLGTAGFVFFQAELGERSYATSTLWSGNEWRRLRIRGAEQARSTYLPPVTHHDHLGAALDMLAAAQPTAVRVALDFDVPAAGPLSSLDGAAAAAATAAVLAIGAERGWTERERARLQAAGFRVHHLGPRALRTETACIAGFTLLAARCGWL